MHRLLPFGLSDVLLEGISVREGKTAPAPFLVPEPGVLIFPKIEEPLSPLAPLYFRYGIELAWLLTVIPDSPALAILLAARTLATLPTFLSAETQAAVQADPFASLFARWLDTVPNDPQALWSVLRFLQPNIPATRKLSDKEITRLRELWPLAGPLETLLVTGGDARIRIAQALYPEPGMIAFSSCTASMISPRGFAAAEACRRRILSRALKRGIAHAFTGETDLIRTAIAEHWEIGDRAEIILAPSGTDASLVLSGIVQALDPKAPLDVVIMSHGETGRGVPRAVRGHHFAGITASGRSVEESALVAGFPEKINLTEIPIRTGEGTYRPAATVAAETLAAVAGRKRTLLHFLDVSKTGLQAPSPHFLEELNRAQGANCFSAIDACQVRFGGAQMRDYLDANAAVLITGSKFYAGPPFSGALLIPHAWFKRAKKAGHLPAGLDFYSAATDWPEAIANPALGTPPAFAKGNIGMILRWTAAICEMKAFAAVPEERRSALLAGFVPAILAGLAHEPRLRPLPMPRLDRPTRGGWDTHPSIVTFTVDASVHVHLPLGMVPLIALHRALQRPRADLPPALNRRFQLGQPVELGQHQGEIFGGLRIAAGAPLFTETEEPVQVILDRFREGAAGVAAKLGHLLDHGV